MANKKKICVEHGFLTRTVNRTNRELTGLALSVLGRDLCGIFNSGASSVKQNVDLRYDFSKQPLIGSYL